jgi:hypothetical protein
MKQRTVTSRSRIPGGRRPHVLIEGGGLDGAFTGPVPTGRLGADVTVCSGPESAFDGCPLVADGRCPAGRPDVVVCAIQDEWRGAVVAAWRELGVPVVEAGSAVPWPSHVGVGVGMLYRETAG